MSGIAANILIAYKLLVVLQKDSKFVKYNNILTIIAVIALIFALLMVGDVNKDIPDNPYGIGFGVILLGIAGLASIVSGFVLNRKK